MSLKLADPPSNSANFDDIFLEICGLAIALFRIFIKNLRIAMMPFVIEPIEGTVIKR